MTSMKTSLRMWICIAVFLNEIQGGSLFILFARAAMNERFEVTVAKKFVLDF